MQYYSVDNISTQFCHCPNYCKSGRKLHFWCMEFSHLSFRTKLDGGHWNYPVHASCRLVYTEFPAIQHAFFTSYIYYILDCILAWINLLCSQTQIAIGVFWFAISAPTFWVKLIKVIICLCICEANATSASCFMISSLLWRDGCLCTFVAELFTYYICVLLYNTSDFSLRFYASQMPEVTSIPIRMNYAFLHLLPGLLIMARLPINPLLSSDTAQASGSVAVHELAYSSLAHSLRAQMLRPPSYWNTHGSYRCRTLTRCSEKCCSSCSGVQLDDWSHEERFHLNVHIIHGKQESTHTQVGFSSDSIC